MKETQSLNNTHVSKFVSGQRTRFIMIDHNYLSFNHYDFFLRDSRAYFVRRPFIGHDVKWIDVIDSVEININKTINRT